MLTSPWEQSSALQPQTAVAANFSSKQLLLFIFAALNYIKLFCVHGQYFRADDSRHEIADLPEN